MERVMVFIDGSNFYHGCRTNLPSGYKVDFQKFVDMLLAGRKLIAVYYYNAPVPRDYDEPRYRRQQKFLETVRRLPYFKVKLGRLVQRTAGLVEKGVDLMIAVDMLSHGHRDNYDVAILVSGDGDFRAVADAIGDDLGKHVENAYFRRGRSHALENACHKFVVLTLASMKQCGM